MKKLNRVIALLLAVIFCVGMCPLTASAAEALSLSEVRQLLNAEKLHPQRTGYPAIDSRLEAILAPYQGKDTYTKIKALYDWTVVNVDYSWNGYSQQQAPAYDKFVLKYDLDYEPGLLKAYPEDMIYRAYHMLTARTGVCYDWGILFAVMARYVGIESYVHTGILYIGDWSGHHGWTELKLGGKNYIFDAQQDNRELKDLFHPDPHYHFGIPTPAARWYEYDHENRPRDQSMLPVATDRKTGFSVKAEASRSGTVAGGGFFPRGEEVTLTAEGAPLQGWYAAGGRLLGGEQTYTFVPEEDMTVYALFAGDRFVDLKADDWFLSDVCAAVDRGWINGMTEIAFVPEGTMNRAMLAAILARVDGADTLAYEACPFADVNQEAWYAGALNWAYSTGVIQGVTADRFNPGGQVTRQDAAVMMVRYLESRGVTVELEEGEASFTDAASIGGYARGSLAKAQALGLFDGYADGTVRPQKLIKRSEGVAVTMRMAHCLP